MKNQTGPERIRRTGDGSTGLPYIGTMIGIGYGYRTIGHRLLGAMLILALFLPMSLASPAHGDIGNDPFGEGSICRYGVVAGPDSPDPGDAAAAFCSLCKLPATGATAPPILALPIRSVVPFLALIDMETATARRLRPTARPRAPPVISA